MRRLYIIITIALLLNVGFGKEIHRYGTTAMNVLEIGVGSAPVAMGEAYVAVAKDLSAIYWNPAGLASLKNSGFQFMLQPWIVDINILFASGAIVVPRIGTFGLSILQTGYGEMDVTNLDYQDGTGEKFTSNDLAFSLSYSRRIVSWFSFGMNAKMIQSYIWHSSANAFAVDLGVLVNTQFFSPTGKREDGMTIGMSIANYGTRIQYDGIDLYQPIDISEYEEGNYGDVPGQFRSQEWELPLLFRVGIAVTPIKTTFSKLTLAVDANHPNNNSESVNIGAEYKLQFPGYGAVYFRGGIKDFIKPEIEKDENDDEDVNFEATQFGFTGGIGFEWNFLSNRKLIVDYSYKTIGILGNVHGTTISLLF